MSAVNDGAAALVEAVADAGRIRALIFEER